MDRHLKITVFLAFIPPRIASKRSQARYFLEVCRFGNGYLSMIRIYYILYIPRRREVLSRNHDFFNVASPVNMFFFSSCDPRPIHWRENTHIQGLRPQLGRFQT
ncbi:hypothetical protein F5X96DRAFT_163993 [Biscogniauxia mediterranea]|nr:hypothetical protein F5X96DRAFT_163993 [Biscogniauxia mediterranea]